MRPVLVLVGSFALAASAAASAAPASDPAFLGIEMNIGAPIGMPCIVGGVETNGPAEAAGIQGGDRIVSFDGKPTLTTATRDACDQLTEAITTHRAGDLVRVEVERSSGRAEMHVTLSTRAEVISHRLIDHALGTQLIDADDLSTTFSLDDGHTTIVGWYYPSLCSDCGPVFERVADRAAKAVHHSLAVIAVGQPTRNQLGTTMISSLKQLAAMLGLDRGIGAGVRAALVSDPSSSTFASLFEDRRIYFTVVDAGGIARFIAPVAPESDDVDAVIDEIVAAAEHCERARVGHH